MITSLLLDLNQRLNPAAEDVVDVDGYIRGFRQAVLNDCESVKGIWLILK